MKKPACQHQIPHPVGSIRYHSPLYLGTCYGYSASDFSYDASKSRKSAEHLYL